MSEALLIISNIILDITLFLQGMLVGMLIRMFRGK